MLKRYGYTWFLLASVVFLADRLTKQWALSLPQGDSVPVLGSYLTWHLSFNEGVAFGMGQHLGSWGWIISLGSLLLTVVVGVWTFSTPYRAWPQGVALACVLGGAWGNLWDRLTLGGVIDFVDMGVQSWRFATFNVADMGISLGVMALFILQYEKKKI
jgi:signal peptidase II